MLLKYYNSNYIEAGVDEVGRGCLAGPVVAAACILPKDFEHPLLNDSKQVTEENRIILNDYIKENALEWAIGEASVAEIDEVNILNASFLAMHRAISQLKNIPEHLLIDGNRFVPYPSVMHTCIIKGDGKFQSIAAASILAKNHRDLFMKELAGEFPNYGWETNVGYPTLVHKKAIEKHGLTEWHRKTFHYQIKKAVN